MGNLNQKRPASQVGVLNIDQLRKLQKLSLTQQNLQKSIYWSQAYIKYPYHFNTTQRYNHVYRKQLQSLYKKHSVLSKPVTGCLVARLFKKTKNNNNNKDNDNNNDNDKDFQIAKTWLIDQQTMEVEECRNGITREELRGRLVGRRKGSGVGSGNGNEKVRNLVFVGKCRMEGKSIQINIQQTSNKHLVIQRIQSAQQTNKTTKTLTNTFLLCLTKTKPLHPHPSKFSLLASQLDRTTIHKILTYLAPPPNHPEPELRIYDNSEQGTRCYYERGVPISLPRFRRVTVDEGGEVVLWVEFWGRVADWGEYQGVVGGVRGRYQGQAGCEVVAVEDQLLELWQQYISTKPISIMVLQTPKTLKIYSLLTTNPYTLLHTPTSTQILPTESPPHNNQPTIFSGRLDYHPRQKSWVLSEGTAPKPFYYMVPLQKYLIEEGTYYQFGQGREWRFGVGVGVGWWE